MPNIVAVASSGSVAVDSLLHGFKWNTLALTFSFPDWTTLYPLNYPEPFNNFDTFNAVQVAAVRAVYRQVSSFTNLSFTEVAPALGDLRFAMSDHVATGSAYYPDPDQRGGDVWFNNSSGLYDDPRVGQKAFQSLLHEVGHSLGLSHPHDETPVMPLDRDSLEFTVMSYRSYVGRQDLSATVNETNGYPQTFMLFDIYALQHMYGANYAYNAGDTVYSWNPSTGAFLVDGVVQWTPAGNRIFMTLWDGNGTDTYDLSNYPNAMAIDLRPGGITDTSPAQLANLGEGNFARGNVFNAFLFQDDPRSLIENAIGGNGNDDIVGNQGANRLDARGGNDIVSGEAGPDILIGGTGADAMDGGTGDDIYYFDAAGDLATEFSAEGTDTIISSITLTLPANVERLTLAGAAAIDGTGNGLANLLTGNGAANVLNGGAGSDTLDGGAGADTMTGGTGNDLYYVDSIGDSVVETSAAGGADTVRSAISFTLDTYFEHLVLTGTGAVGGTGNALANSLTGNAAANALTGGAGNDVIDGGGGADSMTGGVGNDNYSVDHPADKVVELSGAGTDMVRSSVSFTLSNHVEKLVLIGSAAIGGTGNGLANTLTGNGSGNLLRGGAGNDLIDGGLGNDRINGGTGADQLKGGAGRDDFLFEAPLVSTNVDKILDFSSTSDTIYLNRAIFAAAGVNGTIASSAFWRGTAAADAGDRIVYDPAAGKLFYDADGSGAKAAILFATVTPGTSIGYADFVIYG